MYDIFFFSLFPSTGEGIIIFYFFFIFFFKLQTFRGFVSMIV